VRPLLLVMPPRSKGPFLHAGQKNTSHGLLRPGVVNEFLCMVRVYWPDTLTGLETIPKLTLSLEVFRSKSQTRLDPQKIFFFQSIDSIHTLIPLLPTASTGGAPLSCSPQASCASLLPTAPTRSAPLSFSPQASCASLLFPIDGAAPLLAAGAAASVELPASSLLPGRLGRWRSAMLAAAPSSPLLCSAPLKGVGVVRRTMVPDMSMLAACRASRPGATLSSSRAPTRTTTIGGRLRRASLRHTDGHVGVGHWRARASSLPADMSWAVRPRSPPHTVAFEGAKVGAARETGREHLGAGGG
jgi:hypothetical protein